MRYYKVTNRNESGEEIPHFIALDNDSETLEELEDQYDDVVILEEINPDARKCRVCNKGTAQYRICSKCQKILVSQNVVEDSLYE